MRFESKCCCGATITIDTDGKSAGTEMELRHQHDKWQEQHAVCQVRSLMPTWRDLRIGPGHATPPGDVKGIVVNDGGIPLP